MQGSWGKENLTRLNLGILQDGFFGGKNYSQLNLNTLNLYIKQILNASGLAL